MSGRESFSFAGFDRGREVLFGETWPPNLPPIMGDILLIPKYKGEVIDIGTFSTKLAMLTDIHDIAYTYQQLEQISLWSEEGTIVHVLRGERSPVPAPYLKP